MKSRAKIDNVWIMVKIMKYIADCIYMCNIYNICGEIDINDYRMMANRADRKRMKAKQT